MIFLTILSLLIIGFTYYCNYMVFLKMGEDPIYGVIPFYNYYVLFKKADRLNLVWGYMAAKIVMFIADIIIIISKASIRSYRYGLAFSDYYYTYASRMGAATVWLIIGWLLLLTAFGGFFAAHIFFCKNFAKLFGYYGTGWVCGLIFAYPVFLGLIAFNRSVYRPVDFKNQV